MTRLQKTRLALNALDVSRSSAASSLDPALSTLSPEDAEVLDAIITKASDATAFMAVFKAYSEVLEQRGLDPGDDVVYYKQLLKLGVVKGVDWGTKWSIVKGQLGLDFNDVTTHHSSGRVLASKVIGHPVAQRDDDVFTLHSHADETETVVNPPYRPALPFSPPFGTRSSPRTGPMESLDLDSEELTPISTSPPTRQISSLYNRFASSSSSGFNNVDEVLMKSSTPPLSRFRKKWTPSIFPMTRAINVQEQETNRLNDVEAWKKVGQARQNQDADRFRRETLLSICFLTWKGGLEWVHTTHIQIANARNHIQLQVCFSRWRRQVTKLRQITERATEVARLRHQSATFSMWKEQARHRRIIRWRNKTRSRMVHMQRKLEQRTLNDAWTKWCQLYLSRCMHTRNTLLRNFRCWKEKLRRVNTLGTLAEDFEDIRERRTLENAVELWSRRAQMHDAETYLVNTVSRRILTITLETWIRNLQDNHCADAHQVAGLVRRVFQAWRSAKARKQKLVSRCDKYLKRRDDLLLRAIVRVWIARERGQLLDRVQNTRLSRDAFLVWLQRARELQGLERRAVSYSQHASTILLISLLEVWRRRRCFLQNHVFLADQHHTSCLVYRTLLIWRLRLRGRLKQSRTAKMARKYFVERRVWDKWRLVLDTNMRLRKVQLLEREGLKRVMQGWLDAVRRKKCQELTIKRYQNQAGCRLLRRVVQHWTNRVVSIKLREIDTAEQHDKDTIALAFTRWNDLCLRHVETLSLVNSFQDVQREDWLRRTFLKWLNAARKAETRRMRLTERVHELQLQTLAVAWETWRDRFCENELRGLELQVIIQSQSNNLYAAFVTWQARSKSVPGIRFYATNLKIKVWDMWRAAIPLAVQLRTAREMHSRNILSTMFRRWKEAHRTKIALKAVARARYLRLPSPGYKSSQSQDTLPLQPLLHRPLRSHTSAATDDVSNPRKVSTSTEPVRRGISSLLASRAALRVAITDDTSSHVMPTNSAGAEDGRHRLRNELRGARRYRPSSIIRAKSR